jgi:hypothetical protein
MSSDLIEDIRDQLRRLRATRRDVGPLDAISVEDRGNGDAELRGSPRHSNFYWIGPADQILDRLSGLPDEGGPEAIRSEFA